MFTPVVHLQFDVDTETGFVVDNTAYSPTLDFNQVGVVGDITVTDTFGTVVITGGTIDISGGDTQSAPFDLPLDTLNAILNGDYTLVYTITFSASGIPVDSFTAPDTITIGSVTWNNIFDEPGATNAIVITSATTPANNGTFDVEGTSELGGDTIFEVDSSAISSEGGGSAVVAFNVTYNTYVDTVYGYTGCDAVTPSAEVTVLCNTTQFGQIIFQDTTVLPEGQVLTARTWNISYPGNLTNPTTPADVTSALPTVTINTLATGTWTWRLTYEVTVTQADGLVYTYTAQSEATEVKVTCTTLCSLQCGIDQFITQSTQAVIGGASVNQFTNYDVLLKSYYMGATLAQECGDQDKFDYYAGLIQTLLNNAGVDCDCGCDGSSTTGNHWINNAGLESQTEIEQLITDVTTLQTEMLAATNQIYAGIAVTNAQQNSAQVAFPLTYFGTDGYITVNALVIDPFGGTITIRDITTGFDIFSYVMPAATYVEINAILRYDNTNDFQFMGSRKNNFSSGAVINTTSITEAQVLKDAQNTLQLRSSSASTIWLNAQVIGVKYP